jgi:hypothetical protein
MEFVKFVSSFSVSLSKDSLEMFYRESVERVIKTKITN